MRVERPRTTLSVKFVKYIHIVASQLLPPLVVGVHLHVGGGVRGVGMIKMDSLSLFPVPVVEDKKISSAIRVSPSPYSPPRDGGVPTNGV
jgi:hypothetical protein